MQRARGRRWDTGFALSAAVAAMLPLPLCAQSNGLGGTVALSSQLVDRGVAITPATPILQGAASWTSPTGWSAGLSASTELRSPGHVVEALAQASRAWSLSNDWQMQSGLLYYSYPGNSRSRAYDRAELGVNWLYRDILSFGVSAAHVFRSGGQSPRAAADLSLHWPLWRQLSLSAGAGVAQTLIAPPRYSHYSHDHAEPYAYRPPNHYAYGHAGLTWSNGPWAVALDRVATHPRIRGQNGLTVSPWVATLSWSF